MLWPGFAMLRNMRCQSTAGWTARQARAQQSRQRVRELHHRPLVVRTVLLHDGRELLDGERLEGLELELTAVYVKAA